MFKRVCQIKNTYLLYFYFPLNYRGFSKSEGGQVLSSPELFCLNSFHY